MTDMGRRPGGGDMLKSVYDCDDDGIIAVGQTQADMVKATYDPVIAAIQALAADHKTQHENGGSDEIDLTGLSGAGGFVYRGDSTEHDFITASFTRDGTWRDIDLSSVVPEGAAWVYVCVTYRASAVDKSFNLRENGASNAYNVASSKAQVVNIYRNLNAWVKLDANRVIEYFGTDGTITDVFLNVRAWIM